MQNAEAMNELRAAIDRYVSNFNSLKSLIDMAQVKYSTINTWKKQKSDTLNTDYVVRLVNIVYSDEEKQRFCKRYLTEYNELYSSLKTEFDHTAIEDSRILDPLTNIIYQYVANDTGSTKEILEQKFGKKVHQVLSELTDFGVKVSENGKVKGRPGSKYKNAKDTIEQVSLIAKSIDRENFSEGKNPEHGKYSVAFFQTFDGDHKKMEKIRAKIRSFIDSLDKPDIKEHQNESKPTQIGMIGIAFANHDNSLED